MIFSYSESGTINLDGKVVDARIDTESKEYVDRANYIARQTGTVYLGTIVQGSRSPGDDTPNYTGVAKFQLGKEPEVGIDAFNVRHTVITALAGIASIYGLKDVVLKDYEEPKAPVGPQDWLAPGAKIGPPLPGQAGRFSSRYDGSTAGAKWTGPSGTVYTLKQQGFGPLQMLVWEAE